MTLARADSKLGYRGCWQDLLQKACGTGCLYNGAACLFSFWGAELC